MEGRRVTRAEDIADEFATSIRTVYRDIAALAEAGVPIVGEAGVGYSIITVYPFKTTPQKALGLKVRFPVPLALLPDLPRSEKYQGLRLECRCFYSRNSRILS